MHRFRIAAVTLAAVFAFAGAAFADEPRNYTYSPQPPGAIVQSQVFYPAGEAMHSQWRAVLSRKALGNDGKTKTFYQWYLSIYAIDGTVYHLKYQSPKNPIPFDTVERASGANLWFPVQDGSIAGVGELMGPGAQQVVVTSHQMAADCGSGRVDVLFQDAAVQAIMPTLSVENGCDLSAKVITDSKGVALAVTGPYYGPHAAMCCPTKPKATAIFRFVSNKGWVQTPKYFNVLKTP
jgi:hypothetical protein